MTRSKSPFPWLTIVALLLVPVVRAADRVEVAPTREGLTRIGAAKCKMCHKVEFESWSASAHAAQTPALDCESCHGPGSEYKSMAVMKDPAKAEAAGLVLPDATFCTESCHQAEWQPDWIGKAHARKGGA
jgi:hypothetical protein